MSKSPYYDTSTNVLFKQLSDRQKEIFNNSKEIYKDHYHNISEKRSLDILSNENQKISELNTIVKEKLTQIVKSEYVDVEDIKQDIE